MSESEAAPKLSDGFGAPRHVAIIMDGNGRWAAQRGLPRVEGHRRGVEALRRTVRAAGDLGIDFLTIFSFSSENWSRPPAEITELMGLLRRFVRNDLADLHRRYPSGAQRTRQFIGTLRRDRDEQTAGSLRIAQRGHGPLRRPLQL